MKRVHIIILFLYAAIYISLSVKALTPAYVEGDDATTILYHLMGRDTDKQMYYGAYHSGFDFFLSFLPADEPVLLKTAVLTSFVFGFLLLYLIYYWISNFYIKNERQSLIFGILLPLIIPELLFLSLLYNPTNVGFTFCLMGLIGFEYYLIDRKRYWYFIIPVVFMIGIPFRWSLLVFLLIPVSVYFMKISSRIKDFIRDIPFLVLLLIAVIASFLGIYLSGFTLSDIFKIILWGDSFIEDREVSLLSQVAGGLSFFTPALVLLSGLGIWRLFKEPVRGFWIFFAAGIAPFFVLGFDTSLKYLITLLPAVVLLMATGMKQVINNRYALILLTTIILIPWIFGVRIETIKYSWGPGFEALNWKTQNTDVLATKNPDKRTGEQKVSISLLNGGFAMPTSEGPRPAYGYFQTLFGGDWKTLIKYLEDERLSLVKTAIKDNYPIMQDRKTAYNQVLLYRLGMSTNTCFIQHDSIYQRLFTNNLDTVEILVPAQKQDEHFIEFWSRIYGKPFLAYTSYSHILTNSTGRNDFSRLGPFTGFYKNGEKP